MARPRKPDALKKIEGTYRKDRSQTDAPTPDVIASLNPPSWMVHPDALKEWSRVTREMADVNLLTSMDQTTIAMYCTALADYLDAVDILSVEGSTIKSSTGTKIVHPAVSMRNEAWKRLMSAAKELGMTPVARTNLKVSPVAEKRDNPFLSVVPKAS